MSNEAKVEINADTNIPSVTNKAGAAVQTLGRQVEDIGKKFKMAFKDIALSFIAPIVLLNMAIGKITSYLAELEQKSKDAFNSLAEGTNKYASRSDSATARVLKLTEEDEKKKEEAKLGRQSVLDKIVRSENGMAIIKQAEAEYISKGGTEEERKRREALFKVDQTFRVPSRDPTFRASANAIKTHFTEIPELEEIVKRLTREKSGVELGKANLEAPKPPSGLSNIVGVGNNPAADLVTLQREALEQQKAQLEALKEMRDILYKTSLPRANDWIKTK